MEFKILVLGTFLVTLLVLIDTTKAKKTEFKKKDNEIPSSYHNEHSQSGGLDKKKKIVSFKEERVRKSTANLGEKSKVESKKYKIKKDTKYTVKDEKIGNEQMNPKISKSYEKVKRYKVVEDEPPQNFGTSKTKAKNSKQKVAKEETVDEIYKSVKKTSQKKLSKEEDKIEKFIEEELDSVHDEDIVNEKEGNNQKKKKYKLVELILEEDIEESDGNETVIEVGEEEEELGNVQRTEKEEIKEKVKITHSFKSPKEKKIRRVYEHLEEDLADELNVTDESLDSRLQDLSYDVETLVSKYNNPENLETCKPQKDDPKRQGPKKLTLYVIEEEIDGRIKKRVVSEEDGVSMCEVADLLKDHYYAGL